MDKLSNEMDRLQNAIEAVNGWELDRVLQRAMDALRCPEGESLVANLSGIWCSTGFDVPSRCSWPDVWYGTGFAVPGSQV